jgi:hypothetical protein
MQGYTFFDTFAMLRKETISFLMSVCRSEWNNSDPTGEIFLKYDILNSFRKSILKFQVSLQSDQNKWYNTDLRTFMTIPRSILLITINILEKVCRENQSTFYVQ